MADEEQELIEEARRSREETQELREESAEERDSLAEPGAKTSSGDADEITDERG